MSYWLEDAGGRWLGDFATNRGIVQMRERAGPALLSFLDQGEADAALIERVIMEVEHDEKLGYVADMIRGAKAPAIITDGCGEAEQED